LTTKDFTYLLQNPDAITDRQTTELEVILSEFPYFQSAAAIRLKGLYNQNSFRYNLELKKVATQTTDRTVLFDFITSEEFNTKHKNIHDIEVIDTEIVPAKWITTEEKLEQSILTSISTAQITVTTSIESMSEVYNQEIEPIEEEKVEEIIKQESVVKESPVIEFSKEDKLSFSEWLQLTKVKPIVREEKIAEKIEFSEVKSKKMELIDKFIETNPKIIADKNAPINNSIIESQPQDSATLMTETLARVYLEQKKYQKAIEAYEILILKYPEKSVFFADRIENIKKIQQNNI